MSVFDEIIESFKKGSVLTRLIYVNLGVFVIIKLLQVIFFLAGTGGTVTPAVVDIFAVPANIHALITKPWTIFTYMFLHESFLHILFNILWLYWFGRIFLEFLSERKLLGVYFLGGFAGALFYIASFNLFPAFEDVVLMSRALGASAAVLAIVISISVYVPNYTIYLLFLGPVKLKYIAIVIVILDVINIASHNAGGHIAHLGGAFFGYIFTGQYRKGKDLTSGINKIIDNLVTLFRPRRKFKVTYRNEKPRTDYEYNRQKAEKQKIIDGILEKISKSGYESLTKEEKEILFKMSSRG